MNNFLLNFFYQKFIKNFDQFVESIKFIIQGSGYALMFQFRRQFYNIKIMKKEGVKFALMNNRDRSLCFSKLSSLLNYYREGVELLLLQSGDKIFGETYLYPL